MPSAVPHAIHRSWRRASDDCDALEPFLDRVMGRFEELERARDPEDTNESRRCRLVGQFDGAMSALDVIQLGCVDACVLRGQVVGAAASTAYCELAIGAGGTIDAVEWLRGPLNICGLSHEISCDSVFINDASQILEGMDMSETSSNRDIEDLPGRLGGVGRPSEEPRTFVNLGLVRL